jgi:acetyl-CoA acetyltransferase
MTGAFPRGGTAIVGAAVCGIDSKPGYSAMELLAKASLSAIADAGLTPGDIDGVFSTLSEDMFSALSVPEYLGIHPSVVDSTRTGGSAFQIYAMWAALALDAGLCNAVLICYGSNQRSGAGGLVRSAGTPFIHESVYKPRNPTTSYALAAKRHMHEFGTTREQLAEVAVAARKWAQLNSDAYMREPLSIDDVLSSRMVSDPLTVRDCCLVTDGAAAVVMTRADRARDLAQKPAYLLGAGQATWHRNISAMPDLTVTAATEAAARAYAQAGVTPADIDVVQLYDAFTINTLLFLEDLGFCPKGEGGRFVADGAIAPGGRLAVNTNGGGLSCAHPGMYGLFTMVEAVTQLRGTGGDRQVEGVELALSHGNGGVLSSQAVTIWGSQSTV